MQTDKERVEAGGNGASRFSLDALGGTFDGAEIALTDLIETCADAILLIDEGHVIRYWNQGAETLFQYAREEVVGRPIGFLVPADLRENGELERIRARIERDGSLSSYVTRRVRKDGEVRWVSLTRSLLHDTHGRVVGSSAVFRDVTEERRVREELAGSRGLALAGELSANLAHEIKNRLAGIYAAVQILARDVSASDPRRDVFDEVVREVKKLDETACDLLRYAQPAVLHRTPTDVRTFLQGQLGMLGSLAEVQAHEVELDAAEDLDAPLDRGLMGQVLSHLVLNAAEAMAQPGRILVRAHREGEGVAIDVVDDGPGVPESLRHSIFQPFFTTKSQGTGLGLSIARRVVDAHGGTIDVHREPGHGSRFRLRIPGLRSASAAG